MFFCFSVFILKITNKIKNSALKNKAESFNCLKYIWLTYISQVPSTYVSLDEKGSERMQRLIDMLDDLDDVMNVYHNWEE